MPRVRRYLRDIATEASTYAGMAFLLYSLWPQSLWMGCACAVLAILITERHK